MGVDTDDELGTLVGEIALALTTRLEGLLEVVALGTCVGE